MIEDKLSLEEELIKDEGFRLEPYKDSTGHLTGGIGHKFTEKDYEEWDSTKSDEHKREYWAERFEEDLTKARVNAIKIMYHHKIEDDEVVRNVLTNMVFNLGHSGVSKFPNFLAALRDKDMKRAVKEMKTSSSGGHSKWYKQVPTRVDKLAEKLSKALG